MNKKLKTVFILLIIIMLFVTAISLIIGITNVNKDKLSSTDKETYEKVINECISKCDEFSSSLTKENDIESYNTAIGYYKENIEKASSVQEKAYLAGCMTSYALNYFSQKNIEFQAYVSPNGAASPYKQIISDLNELKVQAENLI